MSDTRPMTHFLDALVLRLGELEHGLEAAHTELCGCDDPGNPQFCVAKPHDVYRLLNDDVPNDVTETFDVLARLLNRA